MTNQSAPQKPNPAIGRNIRQSRRGKPGDKAKGLVVAVSLAATLMGWGIFAHEDAQTAALQAAGATPVAAVAQEIYTPADATQSTSAVATATATAVPIVTVNAGTGSDQRSSATTAAASSAQGSSASTGQVAIATTRSSR
jgi:hypothetical protein